MRHFEPENARNTWRNALIVMAVVAVLEAAYAGGVLLIGVESTWLHRLAASGSGGW